MILLNFSHPMTTDHLAQLGMLGGEGVERGGEVAVQIKPGGSLADQVVELVERAGLTPREWQTLPLVVNLPGYAPAAAALLAELHGRMGYFPVVLWIVPVADSVPRRFEIEGLIDLQDIRETARQRRHGEPS